MTLQQLPLFNPAAARSARDEAIERVAEASGDWQDVALEAVYQVALSKPLFASDDIWATGLEKPREPRAMGPVMMRAVRLGYCEATDRTVPSSSVMQHARPLRLYRSLVWRAL